MERYRSLGQEPVISILPKSSTGTEVAVGPAVDHKTYLREANEGSHVERFKDNAIKTFPATGGGTEILTVPRSSYVEAPGSMHLMLVATGRDKHGKERSIPAFSDISREQGEEHFAILGKVAATLPARFGKRWFIGTSINPDEWSRQAAQSIKTIHTHVVGMKGEHFLPFSDITRVTERAERRRALADSTTALGIALLRDVVFTQDFWGDSCSEIVSERDVSVNTQYPKGYTFAISSIEAIGDPEFAALTKRVDETTRSDYKELAELFARNGDKDVLGRPVLRSEEERARRIYAYATRKGLSIGTYRRLMSLSSIVVSSVEAVSAAGDDVDAQTYLANTRLFLKGRAYQHMIFPAQDNSGRILVSIVPRALSGGSPLDAMGIYKDQFLAPRAQVDRVIQRHKDVATEVVDEAFAA